MKSTQSAHFRPRTFLAFGIFAILSGCGAVIATGVKEVRGSQQMTALLAFDSNGDKALTGDELAKARTTTFARYDSNADGAIDPDEYNVMQQALGNLQQTGRNETMLVLREPLSIADSNGDNQLAPDEFANGAERLLVALDKNGNGAVTRKDFSKF